jgi:hypothetical protein
MMMGSRVADAVVKSSAAAESKETERVREADMMGECGL